MRDRVMEKYIPEADYRNFRERCDEVENHYAAKHGRVVAMRYSFTLAESDVPGEVNITMHMHNDNTGEHAGDIALRGHGDGIITLVTEPWHKTKKETYRGISVSTVQKLFISLRTHVDDQVASDMAVLSAMVGRMVYQHRDVKYSFDLKLRENGIELTTFINGNLRNRHEIFVTKLEDLVPA